MSDTLRAHAHPQGRKAASAIVEDDAETRDAMAAELMARAIHRAIERRGVARIALSGGNTPLPAYRRLAEMNLAWDKVVLYAVDERAVPPDHARSNHRAIGEAFGDAAQRMTIARMPADGADIEAAATDYERRLRADFGIAAAVSFDLLTLGVGDDGHTASLFPKTGAVRIVDRLAVSVQPSGDLEPRLSLTAPVICEAAHLLVLCVGEAKRKSLERVFRDGDEDAVPARIIRRAKGDVMWVVDTAAAGSTFSTF